MVTKGTSFAIVEAIGEKELYIKRISPDIVNSTGACVIEPGVLGIVKVGTNVKHI